MLQKGGLDQTCGREALSPRESAHSTHTLYNRTAVSAKLRKERTDLRTGAPNIVT